MTEGYDRNKMSKMKVIIIAVAAAVIVVAAWIIYFQYFKTYEAGKDPKLSEITYACYMTSMYSSDFGYIYDKYTVSKREKKYYAETDLFDEEKKEQTVTKAEITNAEYEEIINLLDGCKYLRQGKSDPDRMDGYMDSSNYYSDIIWDHRPDGPWELSMDTDTRRSFSESVRRAVRTINVVLIDDVEPSSVWIIRDTQGNRKTSIWGTAMIKPDKLGEEYTFAVPLSEDNKYLFRMIDEDGIYYETEIPELMDGWKLRLSYGEDDREVHLNIYDDTGVLMHESSVFNAALGD